MNPDLVHAAGRLGAALAVGLLVGLERGWQGRDRPEGGRVAGLRTFALIGLLGGVLVLGAESPLPLAIGLAAIALLFAVSFRRAAAAQKSVSITTGIAGLVTLGLGALAAAGQVLLAVGTAAVVALLLGLKGELHQGIRRIQPEELKAVLQLGVLTAAILPLLPDRGYGPYDALNPFRLWLAVVLVAGLSLAGHVAARWRGAQQGLLWSGLLGGLASSTAATLALARTARAQPALVVPATAGIVAASGVMFVRMAVVATLLQPALASTLAAPLLVLAGVSFAAAAWLWHARGQGVAQATLPEGPVFELRAAVGFALLLGAVAVLARAAQAAAGDAGVYAVGFLSGLGDVDAPLVSSLQMAARGELGRAVAANTIVLAVTANMIVKAAMAWIVGGAAVGRRVAAGYLAVLAAAAVLALRPLG
ncbi:MAG: MgtC/SapB family protein [Burkholderiales bacterium]|nr:MgtC/SapB family protein [Burkholderiales bacterium]